MNRARRPYAFDIVRFNADFIRHCYLIGTKRNGLAVEIGISPDTLYRMSSGKVPGGEDLAALCKWSKLDITAYVLDLETA